MDEISLLDSAPAAPRLQRSECETLIRRFRPELAEQSDEFRGGVLLLLADVYGTNVDRLVRRSGLPGDFVARGVRRLIDNGWMAQPATQPRWCPTPPDCEHFWLDVEVLLGLSQRRLSEDGRPEWAPVGKWVKDFEYLGARSERMEIHNEYRSIERHDPEPVLSADEEDEELDSAAAPVADRFLTVPEPRAREIAVRAHDSSDDDRFLGSVPADQLLGADSSGSVPSADPRRNDAGLLVGDWSSANWLS
jgi:hypothetical protein